MTEQPDPIRDLTADGDAVERLIADLTPAQAPAPAPAQGWTVASPARAPVVMSRVRVSNFSVSLDGYGAGPRQSLDDPLGVGGRQLHDWLFATRDGRARLGHDDGEDGLDNRFFRAGESGLGATIIGRNMFGPYRGPWSANPWNGWWAQDPPFHHPVFVLTHHARPPLRLAGGTTFHFVQDGIHAALERAREVAGERDIRIGGGVSTVRQYLRAGLIDELHLALAPVLLGDGERLFDGASPGDGRPGYDCVELVCSPSVVHLRLRRSASGAVSGGIRRR